MIPAKGEDYRSITGPDVFPIPFCGYRWIEGKKIAGRALEIWSNITKYVNEILKKPWSKITVSNPFTTFKSTVKDGLIIAKLQYFVSVESIMVVCLQMFHADVQLLPFITTEIKLLLQTLMTH